VSDFIHQVGVGTLVIVGIGAVIAAGLGIVRLVARVWPAHWALSGPGRKSADPRRIFRNINARARHVGSFRKLVSVGPWTLHLTRYRPGNIEEAP
jgi:hypothetical protein